MMEQKEFEREAGNIRPRLLKQAIRYLQDEDNSEDVIQEVMLKLWYMRTQLEQYRSVEALAMVITKHYCLNRLQRMPHSNLFIEQMEAEAEPKELSPEENMISQEEKEALLHLVDQLPDAQQATLQMKHMEGMEISEIARIMGTTEVTVRSNLSRARKRIKELFLMQKK